MSQWIAMPTQVPEDGATVFIRLNNWFAAPFQAKYSEGDQTFTTVGTLLVMPWWVVFRWKPIT